MGVHQRIDRIARRHLHRSVPGILNFPSTRDILHFEGNNGPDAIKRKSPGKDEPWHYIDPKKPQNHNAFMTIITDHIYNLGQALAADDTKRAAFEAAWLAHAITDGLTPAHHYPLEEKLSELRDGAGLETRSTIRDKLVLPGSNRRHQLKNNWEYWGAKGVITTHFAFEHGVATTFVSGSYKGKVDPSEAELEQLKQEGFESLFMSLLQDIADMKMYEEFSKKGWNRHLALETREVLMPRIIKAVLLGWIAAIYQAEKI